MKKVLKAAKTLGAYLAEIVYLIVTWVIINIATSGMMKDGHVVSAIIFLFVAFYLNLLSMRMYSNWKSKRVEGLTTTLKRTLVEEASYLVTVALIASLVYTGYDLYHYKPTLFYWFTGAFVLSFVGLVIAGVIQIVERGNKK
ncbi:hypothetical protein [Phage f2b1]|nr:hypothetical protein [Phage f2b1]